ncbi:MAG: peroxiredoxin [Thiobacillus sp.]
MKWIAIAVLLIVVLLVWRVMRPTVRLKVGEPAPEFELPDQLGKQHRLAGFHGQWLILFFYPRDDTPGCTREACRFRDAMPQLKTVHAQLVGISVDTMEAHARFATKYHLPYPLLADTLGLVAAQYGVLIKFGSWKIARRMSFIVAPDGRIAHLFSHVNPKQHAKDVMLILKALQMGTAPR